MTFASQVARIDSARIFAIAAHEAVGQKRKYSGVPYYTHPIAVCDIMRDAKDVTDEMCMAAYLHDVVEDTGVSLATIQKNFGDEVARLVAGMTKNFYPEGTKRAVKFKAEVQRLKATCPKVKTIKIADSIHNMVDFIHNDPTYARNVYLPEKRILLDSALKEGDTTLWKFADKVIKDFYK